MPATTSATNTVSADYVRHVPGSAKSPRSAGESRDGRLRRLAREGGAIRLSPIHVFAMLITRRGAAEQMSGKKWFPPVMEHLQMAGFIKQDAAFQHGQWLLTRDGRTIADGFDLAGIRLHPRQRASS